LGLTGNLTPRPKQNPRTYVGIWQDGFKADVPLHYLTQLPLPFVAMLLVSEKRPVGLFFWHEDNR
jgi:hypothetical protein